MLKWNGYDIAKQMLSDLGVTQNDLTSVLVGSDTEGMYSVDQVRNAMNAATQRIHALIAKRLPAEEFLAGPSDISFSSSVATLPWNFGRMVWLKDTAGRKMFQVKPRHLREASETGVGRYYWRAGQTLTIDKASVTGTYTIFYEKRPRDIDFGIAAAGGAASITLAASARKTADYYNNMEIVDITSDWIDTIDDYSAARVATISETAAADDFYGIVPEIPEAFHYLIAPLATLLMGSTFPIAKSKPGPQAYQLINEMLNDTISFYGAPSLEDEPVDLMTDRATSSVFNGIPANR